MYNYCKTCFHDDEDIGFCDKCYYNHILEEKGIPPTEYEAKHKPITNADRIRGMTDEELAGFIWNAMDNICPNNCHEDPERPCEVCILDWLKQEVSE